MLLRLKTNPVAIAAFFTAVVTFLMALQVISAEVGAAITGLITAGLVVVRQVVTPVEKVAELVNKPVGAVNELLRNIKLH